MAVGWNYFHLKMYVIGPYVSPSNIDVSCTMPKNISSTALKSIFCVNIFSQDSWFKCTRALVVHARYDVNDLPLDTELYSTKSCTIRKLTRLSVSLVFLSWACKYCDNALTSVTMLCTAFIYWAHAIVYGAHSKRMIIVLRVNTRALSVAKIKTIRWVNLSLVWKTPFLRWL